MYKLNVEDELSTQAIPIFSAILDQDIVRIKQLIEEKKVEINVHAPGGGKTPLHIATEINNESIAAILLKNGADVNAITARKMTPLHVAAQIGNVTIINLLLNAGATIDALSEVGCTPLHEAAAAGHKNAVVALIVRRANPDLKEFKFKLTAAQLAEIYQREKIADILKPESIKKLIYGTAIQFISSAFNQKFNKAVSWEVHTSQSEVYAKSNRNFTFEQDAKNYAMKLHLIGLPKAFIKAEPKGWSLIVPDLDGVLYFCQQQNQPTLFTSSSS